MKSKSAGEKEVFHKNNRKRAAKFSLPLWNSELLAPIIARANDKASYTNAHVSPGKKAQFQGRGGCPIPYVAQFC